MPSAFQRKGSAEFEDGGLETGLEEETFVNGDWNGY